MRGAIAAQNAGTFDTYLDAGMRSMWEEGKNMSDPDVFVASMTEAGLDGAGLLAKTQDPDVKAQLIANTTDAVARGVFGMPTFFVGDEMFFGKDRLDGVAEELMR